jgi:WD40 repeat protein/serine/threonine protein kinase
LALAPLSVAEEAPDATLAGAAAEESLAPAAEATAGLWKPGDVILGIYEVKRVHAGGGMGLVYHIRHRGWNLDLAVKSPRPEYFRSERQKKQFEREAETWVHLGLHPHTVSCYYVRRLEGIPRIFAEYVEGGSLTDWMRQGKLYVGELEQVHARILDIAIQLAWGLHYAHEQGLVHQDVKPGNVLLTDAGIAKVTDFGLARARAVASDQPLAELPVGGRRSILVGARGMTPAYCSPEQLRRERLSRRTDVWSWAVSILELFMGEVNWTNGSLAGEALEAYVTLGAEIARVSDMPPALVELLRACFREKPEERPQDMRELAARLQHVYEHLAGQSYPRPAPKPAEALADSLNNRAISLQDLGKEEEAEALWEKALAVEVQHPQSTYNLGLARLRSGRITDHDLSQQLREVCASHPGAWLPLYLLALVHLERQDYENARMVLREIPEEDARRKDVQTVIQTAFRRAERRLVNSTRPVRVLAGGDGHRKAVEALTLSQDGRLALSGGRDQTLKLWDLANGRCLRTFQGHTGGVSSVYLSANGQHALSGSEDQTLRLWDVATARCLAALAGHADVVTATCLSANGVFALSASWDRTVKLWEVASGRCLRTLEAHAGRVTSVCFSADGQHAFSAGGSSLDAQTRDHTARLWELATGRCVLTFRGHANRVTALCLGPGGRCLLTGSWDKTLKLWEASTGACLRTLEGHMAAVTSVSLNADGRYALSGSEDGTLKLWDLGSGKCLSTVRQREAVTAVALSSNGRLAATASLDRTVQLWRLNPDRASPGIVCRVVDSDKAHSARATFERALARARAAQARGDAAATAQAIREARSQPGYMRQAEALAAWCRLYTRLVRKTLNAAWKGNSFTGHRHAVTCLSLSMDRRYALSGSRDSTIKLWNVADGSCLQTFRGHEAAVWSVQLHADGEHVLSAGKDQMLKLWDVQSARCVQTFKGHKGAVWGACLTADRQYAHSVSADGTLKLWEVATGRCLRTIAADHGELNTLCLSADERFALSGSRDRTLKLWDVAAGQCLRTFDGQKDAHSTVALSVDGRFAVAGGSGKRVKLWDVATGRTVLLFAGHTDRATAVSLSADGRTAVSGGWDQTVRLWDVATGLCLRTFEGHSGKVHAVALSADGRYALSGGDDRTLQAWVLDWEVEDNSSADMDDGARPYLEVFMTLHTPYAGPLPKLWPTHKAVTLALTRQGKPAWNKNDFQALLYNLGCAGYGWLRPEGVRRELMKMAAVWDGPAPPVEAEV